MFGLPLFLVFSLAAIAVTTVATVAAGGAGWHSYNRCETWDKDMTAAQIGVLKHERTFEIATTFTAAAACIACVAVVVFGEEVLLMIPHIVLSGVLLLCGLWLAASGAIGWHLFNKCQAFDDGGDQPDAARDISIACTFIPIIVVIGAVIHAIIALKQKHHEHQPQGLAALAGPALMSAL